MRGGSRFEYYARVNRTPRRLSSMFDDASERFERRPSFEDTPAVNIIETREDLFVEGSPKKEAFTIICRIVY